MLLSLLLLAGFLLLVGLLWLLLFRRRSFPCPVWVSWLIELENPFTRANRAAVVIDHLKLQPGMKVLDIGCGPGRLTIPLARAVGPQGEVVAIDLQQGMLQRAQHKALAAGLNNIQFQQVGMGEGKLSITSADCAVLVTVLGEIPNPQAALQEIYSALKPGGILSITEVIFDPHFQSRSKVSSMALAAGFREKATFGHRLAYTLHLEKPS